MISIGAGSACAASRKRSTGSSRKERSPVEKCIGTTVYGAIYAREMGDSTFECETPAALCDMIDTLINDKAILRQLNKRIVELKNFGVYNGGYEVVKLAIEGKQ